MRNLETHDIFEAARLVKALGIKEELKKFCMDANSVKEITSASVGYDLLYIIFDKATEEKAEMQIYKFLSSFFEIEPEEIAKLDPCEMLDKCLEVADVEKWKAFFSRVAKLIARS